MAHKQPENKPTPADSYWGNPPQTPVAHPQTEASYWQAPLPPQAARDSLSADRQTGYHQVPPTPHPQPDTPAQPATPVQPAAKPKKKTGILIAIATALLLLLLLIAGGCALFNALNQVVSHQNSTQSSPAFPVPDSSESNDYVEQLTNEELNEQFRSFYLSNNPTGTAISVNELASVEQLLSHLGDEDNKNEYQPGVYYVGQDIPAGSYWFEGNEEELAYFTILQPEGKDSYQVSLINNYYGHNLMDLQEGEVLVIEEEFIPLDKLHETFDAPYESGVYRVGTDIPAGTYRLSAGDANDYYAYYIMSNLEYEPSSYVDENLFFDVNRQITITIEEGTYLELYNLTATPNTA